MDASRIHTGSELHTISAQSAAAAAAHHLQRFGHQFGQLRQRHDGFSASFANADPNRIVPVDVMRGLEKEGVIGKLHEYYYTTAGTGASLLNGEAFGRGIAETLSKAGVDAAIMVST